MGRSERPLGPARQGWMTGADSYRAILDGTPYPRAGAAGIRDESAALSTRCERGRAALSQLDFFVHADLFITPTAALADLVLPVASAWEREGLRAGFGHSRGRGHPAAPRRRRAPWRVTLGPLDHLRSGPAARLGDRFFGGDEDAGHVSCSSPPV